MYSDISLLLSPHNILQLILLHFYSISFPEPWARMLELFERLRKAFEGVIDGCLDTLPLSQCLEAVCRLVHPVCCSGFVDQAVHFSFDWIWRRWSECAGSNGHLACCYHLPSRKSVWFLLLGHQRLLGFVISFTSRSLQLLLRLVLNQNPYALVILRRELRRLPTFPRLVEDHGTAALGVADMRLVPTRPLYLL